MAHRFLNDPRWFYGGAVVLLVPFLTFSASDRAASSQAAAVLTASAQTESATIPPDRVVAALQADRLPLPPDVQTLLTTARRTPSDADAALLAARAVIRFGREQADTRLVGTALAVLRPHMDMDRADILLAAATARQYQHDFAGALALLDRAATLDPRDLNVLITRATLHTVQGDYDLARADCTRITELDQPAFGFLCEATTHILTDRGPAYRDRLAQILATPGVLDAAYRPWATGLMAEIAAWNGDAQTAIDMLQTVLRQTPGAQRERLLLADLLLAADQPEQALTALAPLPDSSDGAMIRRLRAHRALGQDDVAATMQADLQKTLQRNLDLGLKAHAREEAMFFLYIANDPALALARAQENWALQHEAEDIRLLIAAAQAAGQPGAADPARDWASANGVRLPKDLALLP